MIQIYSTVNQSLHLRETEHFYASSRLDTIRVSYTEIFLLLFVGAFFFSLGYANKKKGKYGSESTSEMNFSLIQH